MLNNPSTTNPEIEVMTADLARLARAAVIVAERMFDEMHADPAAAALMTFLEADVDVLQDQLRQIDEIARPLRVACRPA